MTKQENDS